MHHDMWVIVDKSRYAGKEAFRSNRARRVFSIIESQELPPQFLVVGDDRQFHTVYVQDCLFYRIDDDRGIFIDLDFDTVDADWPNML
jgi:hypothetical protein